MCSMWCSSFFKFTVQRCHPTYDYFNYFLVVKFLVHCKKYNETKWLFKAHSGSTIVLHSLKWLWCEEPNLNCIMYHVCLKLLSALFQREAVTPVSRPSIADVGVERSTWGQPIIAWELGQSSVSDSLMVICVLHNCITWCFHILSV